MPTENVAEMAACIVLLITLMSLNHSVLNFFKKGTMPIKKTTRKNTVEKKALSESVYTRKGAYSQDSFFDSVFQVARLIPKGRVTSYGAIAAYLGSKLSARMVGWAMNAAGAANPPVPAHRVVNRNGMLSGKHHFATPTLMEELLRKEKIAVRDDRVVDFDRLFWDPTELD